MNDDKAVALATARNMLRPFFNRSKRLPRWKQFQSLRANFPLKYLSDLYSLTEGKSSFYFPGMGSTFPTATTAIPDVNLSCLTPLNLERELDLHIGRVNFHKDRLIGALNSISDINAALIQHDWSTSDNLVDRHKASFGLSFVYAKKALVIALQDQGLAGFTRKYRDLTSDCERYLWAVFCHICYDLLDPAYYPGRASKSWIRAAEKRPPSCDWYKRLIFADIVTSPATKSALAATLLRYSAVSLLDLTLIFWKAYNIFPDWPELAQSWVKMDSDVATALKQLSQQSLQVLPSHRLGDTAPTDVEVYRLSYMFDDVGSVAKWRHEFNSFLFQEIKDEKPIEHMDIHSLARACNVLMNAPEALAESQEILDSWVKSVLTSDAQISGLPLSSSIVGANFVRRYNGTTYSERHIIQILAATEDLQDYIRVQDLRSFIERIKPAEGGLLRFLLTDILFRGERSPDNELERRAAFMEMFETGGKERLIPFISDTCEWSKSTAVHIAQLCTRTFLERLYLLMSNVQDVLETRLAICTWIVENDNRPVDAIIEERDALKREIANLDIRSDLDSTRVHVDEESLRDWYADTQQGRAFRYAQTVLAEGPAKSHDGVLAFQHRLKARKATPTEDEGFLLETQIGSEFILLDIVEATLRTFVSDRTFGLDSYLSRRIRHGTLSGFLITPINRVLKRIHYVEPDQDGIVNASDLEIVNGMFEGWHRALVRELDHARRNVIQVRSERHPDGLIQATWRYTSIVPYIDAMVSRVRERTIQTRGEYNIFPDLYSLCWDVIESDLAQLRLYIMRRLYRDRLLDLNERGMSLTVDQKMIARPYANEVKSILEARVQEICGWFIRPVFRRDKYDLEMLVESTISIIRELDDTYQFSSSTSVENSISLNRGGFEIIGDILFVLLGNAAKHGKKGGNIMISAKDIPGTESEVMLSVRSEVSSLDQLYSAVSRISDAYNVQEQATLERAAVGEGFSGIRKILGLLHRVRPGPARMSIENDDQALTIEFELRIPSQISFGRERT